MKKLITLTAQGVALCSIYKRLSALHSFSLKGKNILNPMQGIGKLTTLLLLAFALQSCTTSRSVVNNCKAQPQKLNIKNINGTYDGRDLWSKFYASKTTKKDTTQLGKENIQTKIHFDGKKYITATVYENGVKKNEITVKAKVYKDYVSIKKHHKLLPFFPFYFYSDVHKFVLYNNEENNLGLCGYGSTTMVILIMSGGKGGDYSATYKRMEDEL